MFKKRGQRWFSFLSEISSLRMPSLVPYLYTMASFSKIILFTDGACKGNPGPGGLGIVLIAGPHRKEYAEGFLKTTNNRMELLAVIRGLELLKTNAVPIEIYSDSKYVVDAINKGWIHKWYRSGFVGKKNKDLWLRYINLAKDFSLSFHWVKGHANHPENNRCDELAVAASKQPHLKPDAGFKQE